MEKNTTVNSGDINEVGKALLQARCNRGLHNEQLFNALAQTIENFVSFPRDRRSTEYKHKRQVADDAIKALLDFAKILN